MAGLIAIEDAQRAATAAGRIYEGAVEAYREALRRAAKRRGAFFAVARRRDAAPDEAERERCRRLLRLAELACLDGEERVLRAQGAAVAAQVEYRRAYLWLLEEIDRWKPELTRPIWAEGMSPADRLVTTREGEPRFTWTVAAWRDLHAARDLQ